MFITFQLIYKQVEGETKTTVAQKIKQIRNQGNPLFVEMSRWTALTMPNIENLRGAEGQMSLNELI